MKNFNIPDIDILKDGVKIKVNTSKFNPLLEQAQIRLEMAIAKDIKPYMPMLTGNMIQRTQAINSSMLGSGYVMVAPAPYGRFLYYGKKMVDSETGKGPRPITLKTGEVIFRYRKGAILRPTNEPLKYTRPGATDHWFDSAKADNEDKWRKIVADTIGAKVK